MEQNKTISDEESQYETESEDEYTDDEDQAMVKPIFVPRYKRETLKDIELQEEKVKLQEKKKLLQLEDRKAQTREMVADCLKRKEQEELVQTDNDSDAGLPDDIDDLEDEEEFEKWKVREITRLKFDIEEREKMMLQRAELERRRDMTAEQRYAEDQKEGRFEPKEKKKWKFLQKYYHKGVFYMDEDSLVDNDVRKRDFNEPTLEDKFDREKLPKVLQVKKFGHRGRTKYTHLLDQDTTRIEKPLSRGEGLNSLYSEKRGGIGDLDEAGKFKKSKPS